MTPIRAASGYPHAAGDCNTPSEFVKEMGVKFMLATPIREVL